MDGKACVLYCMSGAVQRGKPLAQCPFRLFGTSPSRRLPFSALRAAAGAHRCAWWLVPRSSVASATALPRCEQAWSAAASRTPAAAVCTQLPDFRRTADCVHGMPAVWQGHHAAGHEEDGNTRATEGQCAHLHQACRPFEVLFITQRATATFHLEEVSARRALAGSSL